MKALPSQFVVFVCLVQTVFDLWTEYVENFNSVDVTQGFRMKGTDRRKVKKKLLLVRAFITISGASVEQLV